MDLTLNENLCKMSNEEMLETTGGVGPAIVYALGFVMGTTPAGALAIVGTVAAAGVGLYLASKK